MTSALHARLLHKSEMSRCCFHLHLLIVRLQDAAGAPKQPQENQLCLLQAWIACNSLQHVRLDLLSIVRALTKNVLQKQAVVFRYLPKRSG